MKNLIIGFAMSLMNLALLGQCPDSFLSVTPDCIDQLNFEGKVNFIGVEGEEYLLSDNQGTAVHTFTSNLNFYSFGIYPSNSPSPVVLTITQADLPSCNYVSSSFNSDCSTYGECGTLTLSSQAAIDNFTVLNACSEINGSLTISGNDITNLAGLSQLNNISGSLTIQNCTNLTSLAGLNNLIYVGSTLFVNDNDALANLSGLEGVETIGRALRIERNDGLISLAGLSSLTNVGVGNNVSYDEVSIEYNSSLESLFGLGNLELISGAFIVRFNHSLVNFQGLGSLEEISESANFYDNDALVSLSGMGSLSKIGGSFSVSQNQSLLSTSGLVSDIDFCSSIGISGNESLVTIENFSQIDTLFGSFTVSSNGSLEEISGFADMVHIQGGVSIYDNDVLTNMAGLSNLVSILNGFQIRDCGSLINLDDFANLTEVGSIINISDNLSLDNIQGLQGLTNTSSITISNNTNLGSLSGISHLTEINGNLYVARNDALSDLGDLLNLERINGSFTIYRMNELTNMSGLSSLEHITGNFVVDENLALVDFFGLSKLDTIGGNLQVDDNSSLVSFSGLNSLNFVGANFYVRYNSLTDFSGLSQLYTIVGSFRVEYNSSLLSFSGLASLESIGFDFLVRYNASLLNFNFLSSLGNIGRDLSIFDNDALTNIDGIEGFGMIGRNVTISRNSELLTVEGMNGYSIVNGNLVISQNPLLTDIAGLGSLMEVYGSLTISFNEMLENISGLSDLQLVTGTLTISGCPMLTDLSGLSHLNKIEGSLVLNDLDAIYSLDDLVALDTVLQSLTISENDNLVDLSSLSGLDIIGGSFVIRDNASVESLADFQDLQAIDGSLTISNNDNLINCEGFSNLLHLGSSLDISYNEVLISLGEFYHIDTLPGSLIIRSNPQLLSLAGLDSLYVTGATANITENEQLQSLLNLKNLRYVGINNYNADFFLENNNSLVNLVGLDSLKTVRDEFRIRSNDQLQSLNGLSALQTVVDDFYITNNPVLNSINALIGIEYIGYLRVYSNPLLNQCCIIECWGSAVNVSGYSIYSNLTNCNSIEEIQNACSISDCGNLANSGTCGYYALGAGPFDDILTPVCEGLTLIPGRQVNANEAYHVNVIAGHQYELNFCDGYNPSAAGWGGEAVIIIGRDGNNNNELDDFDNLWVDTTGCQVVFTAPQSGRILIVINDANCYTSDYINQPNGNLSLKTLIGDECVGCLIEEEISGGSILPPGISTTCLQGNYDAIELILDGQEYPGLDPATSGGQEGYAIVVDLSPLNAYYGTTYWGNYYFKVPSLDNTVQELQDILSSVENRILVPGIYTVLGVAAYTGYTGGAVENSICFAENLDSPVSFEILSSTDPSCEASASCINGFLSEATIILPIANNAVSDFVTISVISNCADETSEVEYFIDGVLAGSDNDLDGDGFYELSFNSYDYPEGLLEIQVIANSTDGAQFEDLINVTVNNFGPELSIATPIDGDVFELGQTYSITTTVNSADLPSEVEFELIGPDGAISFLGQVTGGSVFSNSFNVNAYAPGDVITIRVIARDFYGRQTIRTVSGIVSVNTELKFAGISGYESSFVEPQVGEPDEEFVFLVDFFTNTGNAPAPGYPVLELDFAGDNDALDPQDFILEMQEENPEDQNFTDGKRYRISLAGMNASDNWRSKVILVDLEGDTYTLGPRSEPLVSNDFLDVAIFAGDIDFTLLNPDAGEEIIVSSSIANTSDFPAVDFVVSLYQEDGFVASQTISFLAPQSSQTLYWPITFSQDGFYPMKVVIDETDVLEEKNELNNFAIRPVLVGDYVVAGNIDVLNAATSPEQNYPDANFTLVGSAEYSGVFGNDFDVSGAEVEFTILETGATYTGYTNANGNISVSFPAPPALGVYTIEGLVTDFTLIGTFGPVTFEVIPRPMKANLGAYLSYDNACGPIAGIGEPAQFVVKNYGTVASGSFDVELFDCAGNIVLTETIANLDGNELIEIPFDIVASEVGVCYYSSDLDINDQVDEWNESNYGNHYINVRSNSPDLRTYLTNSYTNIYGSRTIGTASDLYLRIFNTGGVDALATMVSMSIESPDGTVSNLNLPLDAVAACENASVQFNQLFEEEGIYGFSAVIDNPDIISEFDETNNEFQGSINVVVPPPPPPPPPPIANLSFRPNSSYYCTYFEVEPSSPENPGDQLTAKARIYNSGNLDATQDIEVLAIVETPSGSTSSSITITGGLVAGASVDIEIPVTVPNWPNEEDYVLILEIDPTDNIPESSESDNFLQDDFCWDFSPSTFCSYNYLTFWERSHYVGETVTFITGVRNPTLFTAPTLAATFTIWDENLNFVGQVTDVEDNVGTTRCSGCAFGIGYGASLEFGAPGEYMVEIHIDSDNLYQECYEQNNIDTVYVTIKERLPDLRILSEFIAPSELNPDEDEDVLINLSYDNVGLVDAGAFKIRGAVDDIQQGVLLDVPEGLPAGEEGTVQLSMPWNSSMTGAHIMRGWVDWDEEVEEEDELNNEASRAIIVGDGTNLLFVDLYFSENSPELGETITVSADIENVGSLDAISDVRFATSDDDQDYLPLNTIEGVSVPALTIVTVQFDWLVTDVSTYFKAEILNAEPEEFNYFDNEIIAQLGGLSISIAELLEATCEDSEDGFLSIVVDNAIGEVIVESVGPSPIEALQSSNLSAGDYLIELTDDAGKEGSLTLTIPALQEGACQVQSNEVFVLPEPGSELTAGAVIEVAWDAQSVGDNETLLQLEYFNGTDWVGCEDAGFSSENDIYTADYTTTVNDGSFLWLLPSNVNINGVRLRLINNETGEIIEESAPVSIAAPNAGITVIVHGLGLSSTVPSWTIQTAKAIRMRNGGSAFLHDRESGVWKAIGDDDQSSNSNDFVNDEIILVYDWSIESDKPNDGHAYVRAAGDNLFALLAGMHLETNDGSIADLTEQFLDKPVHLIGHSRGTLVLLEAARRFAKQYPDYDIDEYTALDPHPGVGIDAGSIGYDDNLLEEITEPDPEFTYRIIIPENIYNASVYFRRDGAYEIDFDFNGVASNYDGINVELDEASLSGDGVGYSGGISGKEHSDVHLWYYGTIQATAQANNGEHVVPENWYSFDTYGGERYQLGFNKTRLGGLDPLERGELLLANTSSEGPIPCPFNGAFNYGNSATNDIPGWDYHGGGGTTSFQFGYNSFTALGNTLINNFHKIPVADPDDEGEFALSFTLGSQDINSVSAMNIYYQQINSADLILLRTISTNSLTASKYHVLIPEELQGTVGRLVFVSDVDFHSMSIDDVQYGPVVYPLRIQIIETATPGVSNLVERVELWSEYDNSSYDLLVADDGWVNVNASQGDNAFEVSEVYLFDANNALVGKMNLNYTDQLYQKFLIDPKQGNKEVILFLHNDKVSYQDHPIESENSQWNYISSPLYNTKVDAPNGKKMYQTSMLIPPVTNQSYLIPTGISARKPVVFVHGIGGRDNNNYWGGGTDEPVDLLNDGYTGRYRSLDPLADVWEFYYPYDQNYSESGYLFGESVNYLLNNFYAAGVQTSVVAHSMGGLVTRTFIEETSSNYNALGSPLGAIDFQNEIDKVLFLGTPQNGSFGGNRAYWEIYLPEYAQEKASGQDPDSPGVRQLGMASGNILDLNRAPNLNNAGVQYFQISGLQTQGQINSAPSLGGLGCESAIIESLGHSDGIVSLSSSSLLSKGVSLGILEKFSHQHLRTPNLANYEFAYVPLSNFELNGQEKNIIPLAIFDYFDNGVIDDPTIFDIYTVDGLDLPASFEGTKCNNLRLDIVMPVFSFSDPSTGQFWKPLQDDRPFFSLRSEVDSEGNQYYSLQRGRVHYSADYDLNGRFLYYGENDFSEDDFKDQLFKDSDAFYPYSKRNLLNNQLNHTGVGWQMTASPVENINLSFKLEAPTADWVADVYWEYFKVTDPIELRWSQTQYHTLDIDQQAFEIVSSNQTITVNDLAGIQQSDGNKLSVDGINSHWVDCDVNSASFMLRYEGSVSPEFEVEAPDGTLYNATDANGSTIMFTDYSSGNLLYFTFIDPMPGQWNVKVNGSYTYDETMEVVFPMDVNNLLQLKMIEVNSENNALVFEAYIENSLNLSELDVHSYFLNQAGEVISNSVFFDSGLGNDLLANDNIYTGDVIVPSSERHLMVVDLHGFMNDCYFVRQAILEVIGDAVNYVDCAGEINGNLFPGSPCDDGNASTFGDIIDEDCNCVGQPYCLEDDCCETAGSDAALSICNESEDGDVVLILSELLSPDASQLGVWSTTDGAEIIDQQYVSFSGSQAWQTVVYTYSVQSTDNCIGSSASFEIEILDCVVDCDDEEDCCPTAGDNRTFNMCNDPSEGFSVVDLDILISDDGLQGGTWFTIDDNAPIISDNNEIDVADFAVNTFVFYYSIPSYGDCPAAQATFTINVQDCDNVDCSIFSVDLGEDYTLECGESNYEIVSWSNGNVSEYEWIAVEGSIVSAGNSGAVTVEAEGIYQLNAYDTNGCEASDEIVILAGPEPTTWYADQDGDGLGNVNDFVLACDQPEGYVGNSDDDDDSCVEPVLWYEDLDQDGLGNAEQSLSSCVQPMGYVSNSDDSNDDCFSNFIDCLGVCDGNAITDLCGECLPVNDPGINACQCDDLILYNSVLCSSEGDSYQVVLTFDSPLVGPNGYTIVDNTTGIELVGLQESNYVFGPFATETGYSFTLYVADSPSCSKTAEMQIVSCTTTAVDLLEFSGTALDRSNLITWKTGSETECNYFLLEKSFDGSNFFELADSRQECASNANNIRHYYYSDTEDLKDVLYYRLKEADESGSLAIISEVVAVTRNSIMDNQILISPIPARDKINCQLYHSGASLAKVEIYSVTGQLIKQTKIVLVDGMNNLSISLHLMPEGAYYLRLRTEETEMTERFVKTSN